MLKLALKSLLFIAPFVILLTLERALPTQVWTFRVWEAAVNPSGKMQGPFLSNRHIEKVETGDRRLPNGPSKKVEWFTDKYGYRNRPPLSETYDVVTIGDSNFVGSFLDQKDMFAETLGRECRCSVYNHSYQGPRDFKEFLRQRRFKSSPPKLVVYDIRGFDMYDPKGWHGVLPDESAPAEEDGTTISDSEIEALIWDAQGSKQPARNWLRARLKIAVLALPSSNLAPRTVSKTNEELASEHGDELGEILAAYKHRLEKRGTRFVVFLIDSDASTEKAIRPYIEKAGVDLLALPNVPERASYFQEADSHWTVEGVRAAAKVTASYVAKRKILESPAR
jgi:hypothetical protein